MSATMSKLAKIEDHQPWVVRYEADDVRLVEVLRSDDARRHPKLVISWFTITFALLGIVYKIGKMMGWF